MSALPPKVILRHSQRANASGGVDLNYWRGAGAALLARDGIVGLLKLLKQLGLIGSGDAGSGVTHRDTKLSIGRFGLNGDFAGIGELNRVADEIDQYLRQAATVTVARR